MTAKVENLCMTKRTRSISVDSSERACVNCIWYEQHYRKNRGNVSAWVPTSIGYCLLRDALRGALRGSCENYEKEDEKEPKRSPPEGRHDTTGDGGCNICKSELLSKN